MTKKTLIGVIVTTASAAIASVVASNYFKKDSSSFDTQLTQAANELNNTCPIMADKDTRLDNAAALPDNTFQYNYTLVNMVKDSLEIIM